MTALIGAASGVTGPSANDPGLVLARNLAALERSSAREVEQVRGATALDLEFIETEERSGGRPVLSARLRTEQGATLLASRRRPLDEAERVADGAGIESSPCVVVMGFGLGHHVAAIARRMRRTGVVFVYEPDARLLRAVLERVDHSEWLSRANVAIFTDADSARVSGAVAGCEGILAMGVKFVDHAPSLARLAAAGAGRFRATFREALVAVQNTVKTTLVQSGVTIRNVLMNLGHALARPGVRDLKGRLAGRPAIVVSAGPSLKRNIELLSRPGVRERFLIVAVQTVLKPLLARGIRPHYVTALDYHEISRRFYEGLTPESVRGVTLVAEAKANPAILDAFPGAIRVGGDDFLTDLLGPEMGGRLGRLPPAATVAHMAHALARHLGCDPVILIGQDLGFTDGQYYAAGAAIHGVWAGELNPFRTLEMMEWERIVRSRPILRRATDVLGRPIYTDEQMTTYLSLFERDFAAEAARGLTTIDATEGGVAKAATVAMPLAEALARYAPAEDLALPEDPAESDEERLARRALAGERLAEVRRGLWHFEQLSRRTVGWLTEMREHQQDQARVNALIDRVHAARREVEAMGAGPRLVERLNQLGVFKRLKADRGLEMAGELAPMERQRRQIERDLTNVRWIADAAERLGTMVDDAVRVLAGAPKVTRDPTAREEDEGEAGAGVSLAARRVCALVAVDPARGGLGTRRDLAEPFLCGLNPLRMTVRRLSRCRRLERIVILAEDVDAARALLGDEPPALRVEILRTDGPPFGERARAVRGARLWSADCWRGGPGPGTVFDEAVCPRVMADAATGLGVDAAAVVGADWALVDPALVDAVVERYLESPARHRLTFTQAAPGLAPCVIERSLLNEFAGALEGGGGGGGGFASIGGLLGYLPGGRLRTDPIAGPTCVGVEPCVRDAGARLIPDSVPRRAALAAALAPLGERVLEASAEEIARLVMEHEAAEPGPAELILELCSTRATRGVRGATGGERAPMPAELARRLLAELGGARADAAVTFGGASDPLLHPDLCGLVACARECGIAGVHVRTDLVASRAEVDRLIDATPDVISVDVRADSEETYRAVTGADLFGVVRGNLEHVLGQRARAGGVLIPWVVPRITRCDAVYGEIESFYDRWLALAGAAVIDPARAAGAGERIEPLPLPAGAARRRWRSRMLVRCDGSAALGGDLSATVADAAADGLAGAWRSVLAERERIAREHGPGHPDLWMGL